LQRGEWTIDNLRPRANLACFLNDRTHMAANVQSVGWCRFTCLNAPHLLIEIKRHIVGSRLLDDLKPTLDESRRWSNLDCCTAGPYSNKPYRGERLLRNPAPPGAGPGHAYLGTGNRVEGGRQTLKETSQLVDFDAFSLSV
jgi:hypothetical protein